MDICFLRHAPAIQRGLAEFPNDDRPLTEEGQRKMAKAARGLRSVLRGIDVIVSSPLVRALDTARIAAQALDYAGPVMQSAALLPDGGFRDFLAMLEERPEVESILVVGHEPHLGRTISALLGAQRVMIEMKKGGVCLVRVDGKPGSGAGTLVCHLTPKQLRTMA